MTTSYTTPHGFRFLMISPSNNPGRCQIDVNCMAAATGGMRPAVIGATKVAAATVTAAVELEDSFANDRATITDLLPSWITAERMSFVSCLKFAEVFSRNESVLFGATGSVGLGLGGVDVFDEDCGVGVVGELGSRVGAGLIVGSGVGVIVGGKTASSDSPTTRLKV